MEKEHSDYGEEQTVGDFLRDYAPGASQKIIRNVAIALRGRWLHGNSRREQMAAVEILQQMEMQEAMQNNTSRE